MSLLYVRHDLLDGVPPESGTEQRVIQVTRSAVMGGLTGLPCSWWLVARWMLLGVGKCKGEARGQSLAWDGRQVGGKGGTKAEKKGG